ncbi:MAG TPA: glycosyltransferase family A protein [Thermoanaerobaculia bacterium]|jgi:glycosyltransferase involved in cell wall biosynthesis|nr:glycosyltransferase family A protein [Thermoanaerobaculia bacterium]
MTLSVVMAVYNGAGTLTATLDSILAQTHGDFECVVVDDGSTDDTPRILAAHASRHPRLRVITQLNAGLTRALIAGCTAAGGTYIARHDAGDLSDPRRFELQSRALDEDAELVFVSCWTEYVGPELEPLYAAHGTGVAGKPIRMIDLSREHGVTDGPTHHGSVMFRRDAYLQAGGYRPQFYYGQDWDLWYRLGEEGTFQIVPEVLYTARVTPGAISSASRATQQKIARLSRMALLARSRGESEDSILEEAARIEPVRGKANRARADGLYFIGEALRRNGDPRARRYLGQAIVTWPPSAKAWIRYLQSFL